MAKGVEVWDMSVMKSNQVVKFAGIDGRPRHRLNAVRTYPTKPAPIVSAACMVRCDMAAKRRPPVAI